MGMPIKSLLMKGGGAPSPTDPFYSSVIALLHFDGANGSTTFTDQKGKVWTGTGSPAISTTTSKFGGASIRFNGSSRITTPDTADFSWNPAQLTGEAWINPDNVVGNKAIAGQWQAAGGTNFAWLLYLAGATLTWVYSFGGAVVTGSVGATSPVSAGAWTHVAFTKDGSNVVRLFIDGTLQGTTLAGVTGIADTVGPFAIGADGGGATPFLGYIDDFRLTKGVARYTSSFTPPTAAFPNS